MVGQCPTYGNKDKKRPLCCSLVVIQTLHPQAPSGQNTRTATYSIHIISCDAFAFISWGTSLDFMRLDGLRFCLAWWDAQFQARCSEVGETWLNFKDFCMSRFQMHFRVLSSPSCDKPCQQRKLRFVSFFWSPTAVHVSDKGATRRSQMSGHPFRDWIEVSMSGM